MAVPCTQRTPFIVVTGGGFDSARLCLPAPLVPLPSPDLDPSLFFPNVNLPRRFAKAEEPLLEEVETLEAWVGAAGRFGWGRVAGEERGRPTDTVFAFTEFVSGPAIIPEGVRRDVCSGVPERWGALEAGTPSTG